MAVKIVAWLVGLVGVIGAIIPGLPGTPLIFVAALGYAWITGIQEYGVRTLWLLGILALVAQLIDLVTGTLAPRLVGGSRKAALGALIGSIIGLLTMGPIGLLIGPIVGALLIEVWQGRDLQSASKVGLAAGIGVVFGTVLRGALAIAMMVIFTLSLFR